MQTLQSRFDDKYIPEPNSGCWLWLGSVTESGYGQFAVGRGTKRAHRMSWEIYKGEIPKGLHVLHKCDIPSCVNPNHLWIGTHQDNMTDKANKKRSNNGLRPKGQEHVGAKLTEEDVGEIRRSEGTISGRKLAINLGVSRSLVTAIRRGQRWQHLL